MWTCRQTRRLHLDNWINYRHHDALYKQTFGGTFISGKDLVRRCHTHILGLVWFHTTVERLHVNDERNKSSCRRTQYMITNQDQADLYIRVRGDNLEVFRYCGRIQLICTHSLCTCLHSQYDCSPSTIRPINLINLMRNYFIRRSYLTRNSVS